MMNNAQGAGYKKPQASEPEFSLPAFDELAALAQSSPEEFEALRIELCEQVIANAPRHMRKRLRGLQFQIDVERQRARSPMHACLKLTSLMNESLSKLQAALTNPREFLNKHYGQQADIIPLHQPVSE